MKAPTTRWKAELFDGATPRAHPVTVLIHPDALVVQREDGSVERWTWREIKLVQGLEPGEHVRISRGDGLVAPGLVVKRAGFLRAVHTIAPQAKLGQRKNHLQLAKVALAVIAIGLTFAVALYHWGIPALADQVARRVPPAWETDLGALVLENSNLARHRCPSKSKQRVLNTLFARVRANSSSPYTYRVLLVHEPQVNALAAPGGHVVVFEDLIAHMPSPEALAGVLAHEMQHIEQRHVTRGLLRGMSSQMVLSAMLGDAGALGQLLELGATLDNLAYGRADEREADRLGLQQLVRAGLDPRGMAAGLQALAHLRKVPSDIEKKLSWSSTHPAIDERLQEIEALTPNDQGRAQPPLSRAEWRILATHCRKSKPRLERVRRSVF